MSRRAAMLGALAGCVGRPASGAGRSRDAAVEAMLMVAGPAAAPAGSWAEQLAGPLSAALHPGDRLTVSAIGGRDGVTGANAFEALSNPDGTTAMLVPGAAAMAWLAGDPRVHFDAGRWVAALTDFGSAVLVGRAGPHPRTLRVAASTPSGVELAALLGLSLLGATPVPVFGLGDPDDADAALRDGRVDAVLLTGRGVPARTAALSAGLPTMRAIFSLGDEAVVDARDPSLPAVPTMPERYRNRFGQAPRGSLFDAWTATAAAARLNTALVLQPLTPASLVARWRLACSHALADPSLAAAAQKAQISALPAPACVAALSAVIASENTLLALRRWIAARTEWRPA